MIDFSPDGLARNMARTMLRENTQRLNDAVQSTHELLGDQWDKQQFGSAVIKLHPFAEDKKQVSQVVLYRGDDPESFKPLASRDWQGNQVEYDAGTLQVVRPLQGQPTDDRDDLYYLNEEGFAYERLRYDQGTDRVYFLTSSGQERELNTVRPPFGYSVEHSITAVSRVRGVLAGVATRESSVEFAS